MYASGTIYLIISALIYTVIIIVLFMTKKKVNKSEIGYLTNYCGYLFYL